MSIVHTASGRNVDADFAKLGQFTAGDAADHLAADVYGHEGVFSFKVDGVVLPIDARLSDHLEDDAVVELVDVTDYVWPDDSRVGPAADAPRQGVEVPLDETGEIVNDADADHQGE